VNQTSLNKAFRYAETGTKGTVYSSIKENNEQLNHASDRDRTTNRTIPVTFINVCWKKVLALFY